MCALAAAWAAVVAVPAGSASAQPHPVAADAGTDYVAMGSSFAAGPGIPPLQSSDGASACGRSAVNYPSIVAREIGADLTDVSCSGATTAHVLRDPQGARPPQIQAVTPDTRLVTITIGGNDVNYLGSINAYSCQAGGGSGCPTVDRDAIERTFPNYRAVSRTSCARSTPWRPRRASTWSPTSPCCRTPAHAPWRR